MPADTDRIDLRHRDLLAGPFWQKIPAFRDVDEATFLDHRWQAKHSITKPKQLLDTLAHIVSPEFLADVTDGFARAPMSLRVSPYLLSLIDWSAPESDPVRIQFVPVASGLLPDHPMLTLDSLNEQGDAPVPGLTHRYPDKALFLALDTCPVYCRFCTRSYAVGVDTEAVEKIQLKVDRERWSRAFEYIRSTPSIEDIVISGGDSYQLKASQISEIGHALLAIPHVRRMRFATKGPAVMPMKLVTDIEWVDALTTVVDAGRRQGVEVVLHTHFNHPNEITAMTRDAIAVLFHRGVTVRNQTVIQRRVNDDPDTMRLLVRRLAWVNVHPYYAYQHDLVRGVEDLRTSIVSTSELEKSVRGATAGFNTPAFVVDCPGGGGKRDIHSYEWYDRTTGVAIYRSPNVDPNKLYAYCDPIDTLPAEGQARWAIASERVGILEEARKAAR